MVHPDHEIRVGAHRIFSVVLVPTSVFPRPYSSTPGSKKALDLPRALSRTVSVFSSSAALFEKLRKDDISSSGNVFPDSQGNFTGDGEPGNTNAGMMNRLKSSYSRAYSVNSLSGSLTTIGNSINNTTKEPVSSM